MSSPRISFDQPEKVGLATPRKAWLGLELTTLKFDKLSLFCLLWAVASLIHIMSFGDRLTAANPILWLALFSTAALIIFPGSLYLFMAMLLFRIVDYVYWMPFTPNHMLFEFIINIGMLSALVYRLISDTPGSQSEFKDVHATIYRESLFDFFRPIVNISLIILYGYAVLHKLNTDYFNPDTSCSTFLMEYFSSGVPTINNNYFIRMSAIWGTLLFEGGIPLLLIFRKTRNAGIVTGLLFHLFLAIHPHRGIYSFSALIFSLYFLFTPDDFIPRMAYTGKNLFGKFWTGLIQVATFSRLVFPLVMLPLVFVFRDPWHKLFQIGLLVWFIWAVLLIAVYITVVISSKNQETYSRNFLRIPVIAFWFFPLLVFLNGLNPYFGYKTQTSFSMFSNLRTEDKVTNHLFMPISLQTGTFQHDLVDIVSSDVKELNEFKLHNQLITYFEFRRMTAALNKDFYVTYKRNGQQQLLQVKDGKSNQPELLEPHSWLSSKLLAFRPIDKGPCTCKH